MFLVSICSCRKSILLLGYGSLTQNLIESWNRETRYPRVNKFLGIEYLLLIKYSMNFNDKFEPKTLITIRILKSLSNEFTLILLIRKKNYPLWKNILIVVWSTHCFVLVLLEFDVINKCHRRIMSLILYYQAFLVGHLTIFVK